MPLIHQRTVEAVQDLSIVRVVESYHIDLRRVGSNYVGHCPFHSEKTPSFNVNPSRNICKCFGCGKGGDPISFVMQKEGVDFPQAVELLAKSNGITVEYEGGERTPKEIAAEKKREGYRIVHNLVQQYFVEMLWADNPESQAAREYAVSRWGEEACRNFGVGYAPANSNLILDWLKRKGVAESDLRDLRLKCDGNFGPYFFFNNRVMFPIRSSANQIDGFCGRTLSTNKKTPKYINPPDTPLYQKGKSVYGIDVAGRFARERNRLILVEGAGDALTLHSRGMEETVAPLGKNWSESQLRILKRKCTSLILLPDSDPPGDGLYPPGIDGAMKTGVLAVRMGFDVRVKEIPRTAEDDANGIKHDPDTYIKSIDDFNHIESEPFVTWYARKRFANADSQPLKSEVMAEVAELVAHIQDDMLRDMYFEQLSKLFGKPKNWREAVKRAGRRLSEDSNSPEDLPDFSKREFEKLRAMGIIIKDGCYQGVSKDGELQRWSNFIFRPVLHVLNAERSTRVLRIINQDGQEAVIEFTSNDFVSMRDFSRKLYDKGYFVWRGTPQNLVTLSEYLFFITKTAEHVGCLGWNPREQYYAYADGILFDGKFEPADPLGVVEHNEKSYFLPAFSDLYSEKETDFSFEKMFRFCKPSGETLLSFFEKICNVYGDGGKVSVAWAIACAFRDVIFNQYRFFPVLNLFGRKGSGKTELARAISSLFYKLPETPSSCSNTTIPALAYNLSHARNVAYVLDEFTNDLRPERVDILKGLWGGTSQSKMNMEDKRPVTIPVYAGVILAGQYKPEDEAIYSRCIHLQYTQTSFSLEQIKAFDNLQPIVIKGNNHFLPEILRHRKVVEQGFTELYSITKRDMLAKLDGTEIEDRILKNWLVPLVMVRLLEQHIALPFTYQDLFEVCLNGMVFQNSQIQESSETANFWTWLDSLHMGGNALEKCHFVIKELKTFSNLKKETYDFIKPKKLVFLNFTALEKLLSDFFTKRKGSNSLDKGTLLNYLKSLPQYMGQKSQRFDYQKPNGERDVVYKTENGVTRAYANGGPKRAYVFDYDTLKEMYDLSLETILMSETEARAAESREEESAAIVAPPARTSSLFASEDSEAPF